MYCISVDSSNALQHALQRYVPLRMAALLLFTLLSACNVEDDLVPSGADRRAEVEAGSSGWQPGQTIVAFQARDSLGNMFALADHLAGGAEPADAVVLYFTMWCPTCLGHSDHILYAQVPQFLGSEVRYVLVDYVSGSVAQTRAAELANGYGNSPFITVLDSDQTLLRQLHAAMGTTVVIGPDGVIVLNEDYRNGSRMAEALGNLLAGG